MRNTLIVCGFLAVVAPSAALARQGPEMPLGDYLAGPAPGSPSAPATTVSPVTVANSTDRLDDSGAPVTLTLGGSVASGLFGSTSNTTIWSAPLAARVRLDKLRLTASIPWMRITSAGTIFTGIDSTPVVVTTGAGTTRRRTSGLGDLTLGGAYTIGPNGRSGLELELNGRVKLPTASTSSRLSSGRVDYALGVQVTRAFGTIGPFVSITYRGLGDTAAFRLHDGVAASAGASIAVGTKSIILLSYHFSKAASAMVDDSQELFAGVSTTWPNSRLRLSLFATAGLSNGAAARSGGIALTTRL